MKKLLIGILVLVVIGGGAMFYLSSNAGDMIRKGVIT